MQVINDKKFPFQVGWDLVSKCNLRCKHCFYTDEQLSDSTWFSKEDAIRFTEYLAEKKVFVLSLAGGEPLLYPHLVDVISTASKNKIVVTLSTNAILMTPKTALNLWNAGLRSVQISLDGSNSEVNDAIRGKDTFEKILKGIRVAIKQGFQVIIACVILKNNIDDIEKIIQLTYDEGAYGIKIQSYIEGGLGEINNDIIQAKEDDLKNAIKKLWEIKSKWDGKLNFMIPLIPEILEKSDGNTESIIQESSCLGCQPGMSTVSVDQFGNVRGCANPALNDTIIGNVKQTPLEELWNTSSEFIQIRNKKNIDDGNSSTACGSICGKGCRSSIYEK